MAYPVEYTRILALVSIRDGQLMTDRQRAYALDVLAPEGLVDVRGTWRVTDVGRAYLATQRKHTVLGYLVRDSKK